MEVITIENFEFILTEERQKIIGIEAETYSEALQIIEQLMQENHELCTLCDDDRVKTELSFNDDAVSELLNVCHRCDEVRVIILDPLKIAQVTRVRITMDMIRSEEQLNMRLANEVYICYEDHGAVNRAVRNSDGTIIEMRGTAFIYRFDGNKIIDVTDDDIAIFGKKFLYPDEVIIVDGYTTLNKRSKKFLLN